MSVTRTPGFVTLCGYDTGSFFRTPRMFRAANAICKTISAQACAWIAHAIHAMLLAMKHQNPMVRFRELRDATSHAARTVMTIAGH
jgi:hypothetical protein